MTGITRRPPMVGRYTFQEVALAARNSGMPLEALRHDVTPVGLHYCLIHFDIPTLDAQSWRLEVGGRGWRAHWEAAVGEHELACRATDATGSVQPLEPPWDVTGFGNNAVQRVAVRVV